GWSGGAGRGGGTGRARCGAVEEQDRRQSRDCEWSQDLPRNMTFCTLRRDARFVLGIRTPKGVLDVEKAAKALRRSAPTTIDEVLQGTDPQALKALVDAAVANGTAKSAFVSEAQAPFGPCVTNPEKIMMLGYNYKKHVAEVKKPVPDSPVLVNKYNNTP